ncbi:MAG: glycosyl transferase family 1 [Caulobacterales bacterium 32-69-10]|nr:MAG: glycosyl transferase family 1 [Caulobacterales bacterium 32-69-10]
MASRLAIYHPAGRLGLTENPFGKDMANLELFRALARHGGFERLDFLTHVAVSPGDVAKGLEGGLAPGTRLGASGILNQQAASEAGALLRGHADLRELAWLRRRSVGDRGYSLMGLVHTLAPPAMRTETALHAVAPVYPWDALICTSPAVQDHLTGMFDQWTDYLAERCGGAPPPRPRLPLIPLGVDGGAFVAMADRPEARAGLRAELGVGEDEVLVLWVGRLSYFEKAFPQPMFRAVEEAAQQAGKRMHFALAGWFPGGDKERALYQSAATAYAPSVSVHFLDGNDRPLLGRLWAGADIFLSLIDNIQETFGITPLEAMAAGLPVVASHWDGYRYTMRDGVEAFLIPTLGGPEGLLGRAIGARHTLLIESYQSFVGTVAQHTAVDVGRAAKAIADLAASPELRRTMGAAGRERIRTAFDWPVVVAQYKELIDELTAVRLASADIVSRHPMDPVKGDPFRDFAGFATAVMDLRTVLSVRSGVGAGDLDRAQAQPLDMAYGFWRAPLPQAREALDFIASRGSATVQAVLERAPAPDRARLQLSLVWMCKLGLLDWR